ncbi:hypothetical protein AKO1_008139 [Acrasis kona]|uniref:Uncharacterized protein n=1 Tax=Acrasis kona TaxID=1008807 RepID=A0AAW2YNM3_9EUKA
MVLNNTQRSTLVATLNPYFEAIREINNPAEAKAILEALSDQKKFESVRRIVENNDVVEEAKLLHLVYLHPFPQNRTTTNVYLDEDNDPDWVVFKSNNAEGKQTIMKERTGLLSLTSLNDCTAEPVTKSDVNVFMNERVFHEIIIQDTRIGAPKSDDDDEGFKNYRVSNVRSQDDILNRNYQQYGLAEQVEEEKEEDSIILQLIMLVLALLGMVWIGEKTAKAAKRH